MELTGSRVTMTGFVSQDQQGGWYVTRFGIARCAADALVVRVRFEGHEAPPRDHWVQVTGTWRHGTGAEVGEPATLDAEDVLGIAPPRNVYG